MKLSLASAIVCVGLLTGCAAGSMRSPVNGYLYTSAKGGEGTAGAMDSERRGRACATSILGLIGTGDASIQEAARNGGVQEVSFVDSEVTAILGLWAEYCTVVYGK